MLILLHIVMFQEFVKTLKEAGVDEVTSPQGVQRESAMEENEPYSALARFRPKKKKKGGV
jgi:hypothetical protein